jgi:hypothetical protein
VFLVRASGNPRRVSAGEERDEARLELTEIGLGITVLGVIVNMGLMLGFGIPAAIGWRLLGAFGGPLLFVVLVAIGSRRFSLTRNVSRAVTRHGDDPWSG